MLPIRALLKDIDRLWGDAPAGKICLRIIGSTALMLQVEYERGTKDGDVLEADALTPDIRERLLALAGPGTDLAKRHRLYVDIVPRALPFLPRPPRFLAAEDLNRELVRLEVEVLDLVDVVVSKLKRWNGNDRSDIQAMVDLDLVDHGALVARFQAAMEGYDMDARAEELPRYIERLHRIERELLGRPESAIHLPNWMRDE